MKDCKPMSTPMVTNWKNLSASDSQLVDATRYRQLIRSLMYLVNTRSDICFVVNTQPIHGRVEECSLDWGKTCFEIHCRFNGLWPGLCQRGWSEFGWLHRLRLGEMCY
jgi:hypothetical protein